MVTVSRYEPYLHQNGKSNLTHLNPTETPLPIVSSDLVSRTGYKDASKNEIRNYGNLKDFSELFDAI